MPTNPRVRRSCYYDRCDASCDDYNDACNRGCSRRRRNDYLSCDHGCSRNCNAGCDSNECTSMECYRLYGTANCN
mgnify:FL=1